MTRAVQAGARMASAVLALALGACSLGLQGGGEGPCLTDGPDCVQQRVGLVNAMAADPSRGWIGQPPSRAMIASGVRQFAYLKVQATLTCPQLSAGVREMDASLRAMAAGPVAGQSTERAGQIKALTADVRGQLTRTGRGKGCRV